MLAMARRSLSAAFQTLYWFVGEVVRQFFQHQCLNGAAVLTFTTLLALVPLMTVTYVVLSAFPELAGVGSAIEDFLFEYFVPQASAALVEKLAEFSDRAAELGVVSFAILLLAAFLALVRIESVFNAIWGAPVPRTGVQRLLVYWAALTFGPPLLVGALLATSYLYALPFVMDLDAWGLRERLLAAAPDVAIAATFTFLYYAVPNTRIRFLHALIGGILTALLFELAKWAFTAFVVRSSTALVYGTFAAVPFFLIWLYLVWTMALGGAVFARVLSLPRGQRGDGEPHLLQCIRALAVLRATHARGEAVSAMDLGLAAGLRDADREDIFRALAAERLVRQTGDGLLTLGRSLQTVTLLDLCRRLPAALESPCLEGIGDLPGVVRRLRTVAEAGERELNVSLEEALAEQPGCEPESRTEGKQHVRSGR